LRQTAWRMPLAVTSIANDALTPEAGHRWFL
jgi:hypothetical protein